MKKILKLMKKRAAILKKAIATAKRDEGSFPEGSLRVSPRNGSVRYFQRMEDKSEQGKSEPDKSEPDKSEPDKNKPDKSKTDKSKTDKSKTDKNKPEKGKTEKYLKKEERALAEALAQKDYNRLFLKKAQYELDKIEKTIRMLEGNNADSVYDDLSEYRRMMVNPYIQPDMLYAGKWQAEQFKPNPYMEDMKIYDTRRGEKVRSKSEAILADILYDLGIPYHYEKPLYLGPGKIRYPDFTLLKIKSREEVFLEHFGMLDDEEYRNKSLIKLDEYRKNGIYLGKNLIFTYETEKSPLDIKGIEKMLKDIMQPE